jgi:lysylphosphatidylglycerol synthetase-like protein (DUF2156 family)
MNDALIYSGAGIILLWGIAHLVPTKTIVKGFGAISNDNKKILTMEIISEGLTLIFLGVLPILITALNSCSRGVVYYSCAGMLLVMAVVTLLTGARTPTIWYKICPVVKTLAAVLYILGAVL